MKFSILLISDEKLRSISYLLPQGYDIYYYSNVSDAADFFRKNPADILIAQFHPEIVSFVKDAIAIYPDLFVLLFLEKNQVKNAIFEMNNLIFDYISLPCSQEEIKAKLRLAFEICRIKKKTRGINILNIITPYAINAINSLNPYDVYKMILDYMGSLYPFTIPLIFELRLRNKLRILCIGKRGIHILRKIGYREGFFITISNDDLKIIIRNRELHIKNKDVSIGIIEDLRKQGFKNFYIFLLALNDNILGLLMLVYTNEKDLEPEDIRLWRQVAAKISLIMHHIYIMKELKKVREDLKQSQDIIMHQQRLKVLGQMASGISHDLNNIVFPIIGFTELLLEREIGISKQGRKYLYQILSAAEDIRNIVARLRQFYKKREEIEEELEFIDLNQIVQEVIILTETKWKKIPIEKGINIDVEINLSPDIQKIKGSRSEIREALVNLIFNAVDALVSGGKIIISTGMERNFVKVEIRDTGIGMNGKTVEHCFEPFFTTKGEKGTGLGLSIVYGIMERHKGEIKISSEPGKGTIVTLFFPIALEDKEMSIPYTNKYLTRSLNILHIDDELAVAGLIKEILLKDNHNVEIATDGETGVRIFRENIEKGKPFDLVITDFVMPKLEGRKVASIIKSISPKTPIILLTGWDIPESQLGKHIDLVLKKPVFPKELKNAIFKVICEGR